MRKILSAIMLTVFICSSIFAATAEYDIGGGQSLLLYEDGTYEIVTSQVDSDRIIGKQYKLDLMRTLDPFIRIAMMDDPSIAYYYSMLEDTGLIDMVTSEVPDFSVIFLSDEKVLVSVDGETFETTYRITPAKVLYINGWDGVEQEIGTFNDDYEEICIPTEDTLPVYLIRQD